MTNNDKVNIDDIIGIVKTNESTDSVTLKNEAQLEITEKKLLNLEDERDYYKSKASSLEEGYLILQDKNDRLEKENNDLKSKEIMTMKEDVFTVKELCSYLLDLIEDGHGDKKVEISVNYDHCDHIQGLKQVHRNDGFNWITLDGVKHDY